MTIYRHPDGSYHRYPYVLRPEKTVAEDEYTNPQHWKQLDGAPPGVEIHRDGKTMRNNAPSTPAK